MSRPLYARPTSRLSTTSECATKRSDVDVHETRYHATRRPTPAQQPVPRCAGLRRRAVLVGDDLALGHAGQDLADERNESVCCSCVCVCGTRRTGVETTARCVCSTSCATRASGKTTERLCGLASAPPSTRVASQHTTFNMLWMRGALYGKPAPKRLHNASRRGHTQGSPTNSEWSQPHRQTIRGPLAIATRPIASCWPHLLSRSASTPRARCTCKPDLGPCSPSQVQLLLANTAAPFGAGARLSGVAAKGHARMCPHVGSIETASVGTTATPRQIRSP